MINVKSHYRKTKTGRTRVRSHSRKNIVLKYKSSYILPEQKFNKIRMYLEKNVPVVIREYKNLDKYIDYLFVSSTPSTPYSPDLREDTTKKFKDILKEHWKYIDKVEVEKWSIDVFLKPGLGLEKTELISLRIVKDMLMLKEYDASAGFTIDNQRRFRGLINIDF